MNATALSLFEQQSDKSISNSPLYLVPAVWGSKTKNFSELDTAQREKYRVLAPVLEKLKEEFSQIEKDSNGISGTEYILKGLVLYKMAYMVQYYLNCKGPRGGEGMPRDKDPLLERMEPLGRA